MRRAVAEYTVLGIKTTLPFFDRVLRHPAFVAGEFDTSFIETACWPPPEPPARRAVGCRRRGGRGPAPTRAAGGRAAQAATAAPGGVQRLARARPGGARERWP